MYYATAKRLSDSGKGRDDRGETTNTCYSYSKDGMPLLTRARNLAPVVSQDVSLFDDLTVPCKPLCLSTGHFTIHSISSA